MRGYVQQPASCGRMRVRQQRRLRPCTASHVPGKQKDDTSEVSDSTPAQRQQDGCKQPGDTQCRGKSRKPTSRSRRGSRKLCALGLRFAAASLEACGALPRDAACLLCPGPSCALFQLSVWVYRVLRSSSMLLVPGRFCTGAATLRVRALRAVAAQSLLCLPRLRCFAFRPHSAVPLLAPSTDFAAVAGLRRLAWGRRGRSAVPLCVSSVLRMQAGVGWAPRQAGPASEQSSDPSSRDCVLLPSLPPSSRALLRSQAGPHAGAWLTALPCDQATSIPPQAMQIALRRRLRLPLPVAPAVAAPALDVVEPWTL